MRRWFRRLFEPAHVRRAREAEALLADLCATGVVVRVTVPVEVTVQFRLPDSQRLT